MNTIFNHDFGDGWVAASIQAVTSAYKTGSGRFYVWAVNALPGQPGNYYVCFGCPEEGYSGRWFDWLVDAVDYCHECAG